MLTRACAIDIVLSWLDDELVVSVHGFPSHETLAAMDRPENFYMIDSMGLAGAIGLGMALARPERHVVVIDGDSNVLMGLDALPMIAQRAPAHFLHVVLDNQPHASTGGKRSITDTVILARIAQAAGYRHVRHVESETDLGAAVDDLLRADGPAFLLVKIVQGSKPAPCVPHSPEMIADRFRRAVRCSEKDSQ
jgi:sulfopyruvate decarboxylase subunit beta